MRTKFNYLTIAALLITTTVTSFAQPTSSRIEGLVSNKKGEPIEYVTVLLQQPHDSITIAGTTTDSSGLYRFKSVPRGNYILTLNFIGYKNQSVCVEVQSEVDTHVIPPVTLTEEGKLLNEVIVRGQKPLIEQEGDKLIINVQNSVVAAGGNAAELLARVPGVSVDQSDQISLNGKTGVTVLIDGKITNLPPPELATFLRSMNANNVGTIEVISSPPARYDAAGNSGMINIKTKKNTLEGFNGSATLGTGYGRYGKVNGNLNLNYRKKKWTHFFNYGYVFDKRFYYAEAERISYQDDHAISFVQQIDRVQHLPSHNWQAESEWQWNSGNSIAINTAGSFNERSTDNDSFLQIGQASTGKPDSTFTIENGQQSQWRNISASVGYKHVFTRAGSELTVDFDNSVYNFRLNDNFRIRRFSKEDIYQNEYNILSDQPSSFRIYTGRADYKHRVNERTSFETGMKYSYVKTLNNIFFSNNLSGKFKTDTTRSSDFSYAEQITAGYISLRTRLFGLDVQLGLRAEHTQYAGFSAMANKSIERSYFKLFPNIDLHRNVSENYQVRLAYSYRIDRPTYRDLYPYVYYYDPFDSQFGNPTLLPQFTHNIQLSQTIAKDYVINAGYSSITQFMTFAILLYEDQVSSYAIKKNFDAFQNYYLNAIVPIRLSKGWMMNCSLNLFYNKFSTQLFNEVYKSGRLSGIVNVSQTFILPWGMSAELTGLYNSSNVAGLFNYQGQGSLNVGLQKHLLDQKATVRLNITDVFETNRARFGIEYPGLDMDIYVRNETRIVRMNFTYTIGNSSTKVQRRRNTLEDEQKRVGTN